MRFWGLALILVIAAAGLFISNIKVVSLIKGSHYVKDISGNGNDVNCSACHKHVAEEMAITRALHGPHWDLSCEACHRYNGTGITFATANSSGAFPGKQAHAAYVPSCLDCHGGKGAWVVNVSGVLVHAPPARAFNVTTNVNGRNVTVVGSIPYLAAHKQFIAYCENISDENLACLACHTNYSINITYSYHYNLIYNLSAWNFTGFQPNGTRTFTSNYIKTSNFSGKHIFIPVNKINCSKCHLNIYLGLLNGTHAPIYTAWGSSNLWGFYRYHGLATSLSTLNTSWVNKTYCDKCHFAINVSLRDATTGLVYNFPSISSVTNASKVHCAEKVSCLTCHRNWTDPNLWWLNPYYAIINGTRGGITIAQGHATLFSWIADNSSSFIPRMFHGDVCMGCHNATIHPPTSCGHCHSSGGPGWISPGTVNVDIYSEPDGRVTVT